MKKNEPITKDNYKEIIIRRAIILCWVFLAICFVIKICGGNFFNIICKNELFIKVCNYIDSTFLYYIVAFIFYFTTNIIFLHAISSQNKLGKFNIIIVSFCIICLFIIKSFNVLIGTILDIIIIEIVLPIIILKRQNLKWKQIILQTMLAFVLINAFQLISLFVKNLGIFKIMLNNSLIQIIFSIDYIIMLILYLLYHRKINLKKEAK